MKEISREKMIKLYNSVFSLFLDDLPNDAIYDAYIADPDQVLLLQDFVSNNLKSECRWMTAISIIDAAENIISEAVFNNNIE